MLHIFRCRRLRWWGEQEEEIINHIDMALDMALIDMALIDMALIDMALIDMALIDMALIDMHVGRQVLACGSRL
jgi:hypothetical protein